MFFKSSVLVYATPCSGKYEKDPVARAFEIMGWAKAKFQFLEWCGVLSKASIPLTLELITAIRYSLKEGLFGPTTICAQMSDSIGVPPQWSAGNIRAVPCIGNFHYRSRRPRWSG